MEKKKENWIDALHCQAQVHCNKCLNCRDFYNKMATAFVMPVFGECPHGQINKNKRIILCMECTGGHFVSDSVCKEDGEPLNDRVNDYKKNRCPRGIF
jgi:hypothetical protein